MMTGIGMTLVALAILGIVALGLALLGANNAAERRSNPDADREDLEAQLRALKAYAERKRRMREECAEIRRRSEGGHAA